MAEVDSMDSIMVLIPDREVADRRLYGYGLGKHLFPQAIGLLVLIDAVSPLRDINLLIMELDMLFHSNCPRWKSTHNGIGYALELQLYVSK